MRFGGCLKVYVLFYQSITKVAEYERNNTSKNMNGSKSMRWDLICSFTLRNIYFFSQFEYFSDCPNLLFHEQVCILWKNLVIAHTHHLFSDYKIQRDKSVSFPVNIFV